MIKKKDRNTVTVEVKAKLGSPFQMNMFDTLVISALKVTKDFILARHKNNEIEIRIDGDLWE